MRNLGKNHNVVSVETGNTVNDGEYENIENVVKLVNVNRDIQTMQ